MAHAPPAVLARTRWPRICLLLLATQLLFASAVTLRPRRKLGLSALRRLIELEQGGNSLSVDIGGTLVKLVLFQRRHEQPEEGGGDGKPRLEFEDHEARALGASRELSVHIPELGGEPVCPPVALHMD